MLLEEQLAKVQQGIDQTNPQSPIGQILAFQQEKLQSEIAKVHEDRFDAIRTLLSEEMARREEIQGQGDRRASGHAQGVPSPAPQPQTGRTLAIKQMLLEEQLAKIQQGIDQTNPRSPIGQILAFQQEGLQNEIAQVHEERFDAIRILLSEEIAGSPVSPRENGLERPPSMGSQLRQAPVLPVRWMSNQGKATSLLGEDTQLPVHGVATIPRILRGQEEPSQTGIGAEKVLRQQTSDFSQTGPASQETNVPPHNKTNPQGLRAKLDRGQRGQGGYINADSGDGTASARRSDGKNELPGRPLWKGNPPEKGDKAKSGANPPKPPPSPLPFLDEALTLGRAYYEPKIDFMEWAEKVVAKAGPGIASHLGFVWRTMQKRDVLKPPRNYPEAAEKLNRLSQERKALEDLELSISEMAPPTDWRLRALRSRLGNFSEEARQAVSVAKDNQVTIVAVDDGLPQAMKDMVSEGAEIVRRFASSKFLPIVFRVESIAGEDSHYGNKRMLLGTEASASVVAHEIGHDISDRNKHVKRAALDFLMKRAKEGGQATVAEINKKSKSTDIVYLDRWVERGGTAYTGRLYGDGGTEIISVGIQRLNGDPIAFFNQDLEFFEFIVNTLQQW